MHGGDPSIVMMSIIEATTSSQRLIPSPPVKVSGASALALCLGLLAAPPTVRAEDEVKALPDPLNPVTGPASDLNGYFGGGSLPPSLRTPSRLRVGDFAIAGQAAFGILYDDNVEADDEERDEDVFLSVSPSVRAQSTYARHSIGFGAGATAATALKDTTDDFFNWRIGADGRVDLSERSRINAAVDYSRDIEDDENVDAEDDNDDIPVNNVNARLGYATAGQRLGYSIGGDVARFDIEGDDFQDRDRTSIGLNGSLRYRWSEDLSFSGGPTYRHSTFDEDVADDGDGRDADEFGLQLGVGYRFSRTITTRAAVGYSLVAFDDPDREDNDTATGSAGLTWSPGNGTMLDLDASRSLAVSVEDDEDSRTRTSGSATLVHRLSLGSRSALSSSLALSIARLSDLDRTDRDLIAGLTFAYRLTDSAFLSTSYRFSHRSSNDDDAEFYRNLLSVGLTVSY